MKNLLKGILYLLLITPIYGQIQLEGFVFDDNTNDPIPYATIILTNSENAFVTGVTTNEDGFYELSYNKGDYSLQVDFIGYKTYTTAIELNGNTTKNIKLLPEEELEIAPR